MGMTLSWPTHCRNAASISFFFFFFLPPHVFRSATTRIQYSSSSEESYSPSESETSKDSKSTSSSTLTGYELFMKTSDGEPTSDSTYTQPSILFSSMSTTRIVHSSSSEESYSSRSRSSSSQSHYGANSSASSTTVSREGRSRRLSRSSLSSGVSDSGASKPTGLEQNLIDLSALVEEYALEGSDRFASLIHSPFIVLSFSVTSILLYLFVF